MDTLKHHVEAEVRIRRLLEESHLPAPDAIEYEEGSVWVFWDEPRVALEIDLELGADGTAEEQANPRRCPK